MSVLGVIAVPEAGTPYRLARTVPAEPSVGRRIQHPALRVAQQRNRIAFDHCTETIRPGCVRDVKPQERHPANQIADPAFESMLGIAHVARRRAPLTPCPHSKTRIALQQRCADSRVETQSRGDSRRRS